MKSEQWQMFQILNAMCLEHRAGTGRGADGSGRRSGGQSPLMALRGHATEPVLPTEWVGGRGEMTGGLQGRSWQVVGLEQQGTAGGGGKVMTHDNLKCLR